MYLLSEHWSAVEGVLENCRVSVQEFQACRGCHCVGRQRKVLVDDFQSDQVVPGENTGWARFVVTIASVVTVLDLVIIKILEVPSTCMLPPFALNS